MPPALDGHRHLLPNLQVTCAWVRMKGILNNRCKKSHIRIPSFLFWKCSNSTRCGKIIMVYFHELHTTQWFSHNESLNRDKVQESWESWSYSHCYISSKMIFVNFWRMNYVQEWAKLISWSIREPVYTAYVFSLLSTTRGRTTSATNREPCMVSWKELAWNGSRFVGDGRFSSMPQWKFLKSESECQGLM